MILVQKRNRILLCRYAKKRKRTNKRTNKKKSVSLFGAQFRVCAFRNQSKLKSCEVPNRAPAPPTACYPLGVPLRAVQANASLKPLCVDTVLLLQRVLRALQQSALSLVTSLVTIRQLPVFVDTGMDTRILDTAPQSKNPAQWPGSSSGWHRGPTQLFSTPQAGTQPLRP